MLVPRVCDEGLAMALFLLMAVRAKFAAWGRKNT
jgi:hypothetical protein